MKQKLTEKQLYALEVIGFEPKTASELGVAAATLTSLVNKGLIEKIGAKSPFKYKKIAIEQENPGAVKMTTIDGQEFDYNCYVEDQDSGMPIRWNDNRGNPHTGTLLRMREGDEGFYARSREFGGIVFVKFADTCILVECDEKGNYVREFYRH